jgi:membrane-associated phospholipid phosphatase
LSIGLCVALVDRSVSTWIHAHLGDERFAWFTGTYNGHPLRLGPFSLMAAPAEAMGSLAFVLFAVLALAASTGRRPTARGQIGLALCLSIFAAIAINSIAKPVFSRTWPESWQGDNPSWIRDGVFGFFPFHGGAAWGSFPSGHTTTIMAPASILWLVWPELRLVWATVVVVVIIGLLGANYHFVSDIIGGLYLGGSIGLGVASLMLSPFEAAGAASIGSKTGQSPQ